MLDARPWGTRRPCHCPGLAPAGQEGPYLLSWVFSEPLDHVLQFPERDGVGSESRPGSRPGRTRLGAEGRAAELAASGDARTGPGTCQESFRSRPGSQSFRSRPGSQKAREEDGRREAGHGGATAGETGTWAAPDTHLVNFSCARALQQTEGNAQ